MAAFVLEAASFRRRQGLEVIVTDRVAAVGIAGHLEEAEMGNFLLRTVASWGRTLPPKKAADSSCLHMALVRDRVLCSAWADLRVGSCCIVPDLTRNISGILLDWRIRPARLYRDLRQLADCQARYLLALGAYSFQNNSAFCRRGLWAAWLRRF